MKTFRKQFSECCNAGYNKEKVFKSFKDYPNLLPAFPKNKMKEAIQSGKFNGVDIILCGRFGGECNSNHPDCINLRLVNF